MELIGIERLEEAFALYRDCKAMLEKQNIFQWTDAYPNLGIIAADIENGHLYGYLNGGKILGLMVLNELQDTGYSNVKWEYTGDKILVIHRLAVSPNYQKQGIATRMMDFTENFARNNQYTSIRFDSYSANQRSVALYQNRGYKKSGEVYFPGRELVFYCFEKKVE